MCSPVFAAMFHVDMKERAATDVPIGDVRSANHFKNFLAMISPGRQMLFNRIKNFVTDLKLLCFLRKLIQSTRLCIIFDWAEGSR